MLLGGGRDLRGILRGMLLFVATGPLLSALTSRSTTYWNDASAAKLTADNMKQIDDDDNKAPLGFLRTDSEWSLGLSRPEFSKTIQEFGICNSGALLVFTARVCTYTVLSLWALKAVIHRTKGR